MRQETINFFLGLFIGILIGLILVLAGKAYLVEPKEREIMNAYKQKQAYYEEIFKSDKYVKYFVEGPMMMFLLNPKYKWDPNQLAQFKAE